MTRAAAGSLRFLGTARGPSNRRLSPCAFRVSGNQSVNPPSVHGAVIRISYGDRWLAGMLPIVAGSVPCSPDCPNPDPHPPVPLPAGDTKRPDESYRLD